MDTVYCLPKHLGHRVLWSHVPALANTAQVEHHKEGVSGGTFIIKII